MQKKVLPFSLKASGWFLSNLGRLFPGLTARIFFRLYATPPKKRWRASELAMKEQAQIGELVFSKYEFDPGPLKIVVYRWGVGSSGNDPRKKILLMHGWGGNGPGFQPLIEELLQEGYEVVAIDAPAHGASDGKRTNLVQWIHILGAFLRQEGPFYAVIGHSVGALVSALTLARTDIARTKLVLAGPPLSAPSFFQDTFELFRIRPRVIQKVYGLVRTRLKDDLLTMDLRHCIGPIGAERILLIYDTRDQLVRSGDIEALLREYPGLHWFKIEGEGHFRILRSRAAIGEILKFLE